MASVQVGQFSIWPDSNTGTRPNALRIKGKGILLVLYSGPTTFFGDWDLEGWPMEMENKVFAKLTSREGEILRAIGVNLPPGISSFTEETTRILQERVDKIGSAPLEETFKKVFDLCCKEIRCRQLPRLIWLPR